METAQLKRIILLGMFCLSSAALGTDLGLKDALDLKLPTPCPDLSWNSATQTMSPTVYPATSRWRVNAQLEVSGSKDRSKTGGQPQSCPVFGDLLIGHRTLNAEQLLGFVQVRGGHSGNDKQASRYLGVLLGGRYHAHSGRSWGAAGGCNWAFAQQALQGLGVLSLPSLKGLRAKLHGYYTLLSHAADLSPWGGELVCTMPCLSYVDVEVVGRYLSCPSGARVWQNPNWEVSQLENLSNENPWSMVFSCKIGIFPMLQLNVGFDFLANVVLGKLSFTGRSNHPRAAHLHGDPMKFSRAPAEILEEMASPPHMMVFLHRMAE